MPTKHVDKLVEAYLDDHLSTRERRQVEAHIRVCPTCTHRLFEAERVHKQLKPVMRSALGRPTPRPSLRREVREALRESPAERSFNWAIIPVRFLNSVGTVAVIALLAFGLFMVLQSQIPNNELISNITPLTTNSGGGDLATATPASSPTPVASLKPSPTPPRTRSSISDTLPTATPLPPVVTIDTPPASTAPVEITQKIESALSTREESEMRVAFKQLANPPLPEGTIAYALFNPTPGRQLYEIHFISPDGTPPQTLPLDGISEPALHPTSDKNLWAFRAWNGPTSPRSLLSGDLSSRDFESVTDFWEDAQPDWSPTEDRIIFASQRESDRSWRLYSVWGDGSTEVNLRREGKSPTFAPDGYRFAFESCDSAGNQCGLWIGDLEHSEYESKIFLADPLAKSPDWSPVGETMAYMANPDGNWDLYLVNSNGSNVRRLTDDPAIDGLPAWSPDGKWLAFVSNRGGEWGIWLLHVGSGKLHHTVTFKNGTLASPDLMPYSEHGPRQWWDEQLSWGK